MSNLLIVNPPFKFEGNLVELNNMFKPVEKFEMIYHSENLSQSTNHCFNLIGSICGYISAKNHTDAMLERYAVIEEALRVSLNQYKIKIDEIVKNSKKKIERGLEIFNSVIKENVDKLKKEYRELRSEVKNKIKKEEILEKIKEKLINIYKNVKEFFKSSLKIFEDIVSDYDKYTQLCDEYIKFEKEYLKVIKL